jgi:phenylacetate-coenzyme A ligase PaaK-like adenylate-forming protein
MSDSLRGLIGDLLRRPWSEIGAGHYLDEYNASQWLSSSALHALQMAKLRRLVWHCMLEVPALRATIGAQLAPSQIEKLDDITRLPISQPNGVACQADTRELAARRAAIRARSSAWEPAEQRWWVDPARGVLAAPCRESGAAMHVHADHLIVECLTDEGPIAVAGAVGRLVLTDLHDYAHPAVRGDLCLRGRLLADPCPCGRMLPLVELAALKAD